MEQVCLPQFTFLIFSITFLGVLLFAGYTIQKSSSSSVFTELPSKPSPTTTTQSPPSTTQPPAPIIKPSNESPGIVTSTLVPSETPRISSQTYTPVVRVNLKPDIQQITIVPPDGLNSGPDRVYVNSYDTTWHPMGYVYNPSSPDSTMRLYGRRKYPRSDKWEYYIIDKNGIKIPFELKNSAEIYDDDPVSIPGYPSLVANIYEVKSPIYSPYY